MVGDHVDSVTLGKEDMPYFDMAISALREQESLAEKQATSDWISVEERLPEDRYWVLVWHTGYATPKKAKYKDDIPGLPIFLLDGDNGLDGDITHWMPLPEPPEVEV